MSIDKQTKIIFKIIKNRFPEKITEEEFYIHYLSELMFLYVDTYGVPEEIVVNIIKDWIKNVRSVKKRNDRIVG